MQSVQHQWLQVWIRQLLGHAPQKVNEQDSEQDAEQIH